MTALGDKLPQMAQRKIQNENRKKTKQNMGTQGTVNVAYVTTPRR